MTHYLYNNYSFHLSRFKELITPHLTWGKKKKIAYMNKNSGGKELGG